MRQWKPLLLPLLAPPSIKGPSETTEVSVVLGFSTQLPCDVEGSPTPSITWLKDNQPIVSSPRLTYARGGQALRLGSAQGDSTGLYTCRATNPAGTAVKHYSLSVLGKKPPNNSKQYLRTFNYVFYVPSSTTDRRWLPSIWHPGRESKDEREFNAFLHD